MSIININRVSDDEWRVVDEHRVLGWVIDISGCDENGKTVGRLCVAFVPGPKKLIQFLNGDKSHAGKHHKRHRGMKTNRRLIGSVQYEIEAESAEAKAKAIEMILQSEGA